MKQNTDEHHNELDTIIDELNDINCEYKKDNHSKKLIELIYAFERNRMTASYSYLVNQRMCELDDITSELDDITSLDMILHYYRKS